VIPSAGNWEGNRRSGDALTTCHTFQWFIQLYILAHDLRKRDERTAYIEDSKGYGTV